MHIQQNFTFVNFEFWALSRPAISGSALPQLHGMVAPQLRGWHVHEEAADTLQQAFHCDYGSQDYNIDMQMKHLLIINQTLFENNSFINIFQLLKVTAELPTNEMGVLVCLAQSNPEIH